MEDFEEEEDFKLLTPTEAPILLADKPSTPRASPQPSQQLLDSLNGLGATAYTSSALKSILPENTLDIYIIGAAPFDLLSRKPGVECFAASIHDVEKALVTKKVQLLKASIGDVEKALTPKKVVDPARILPKEYYDFLNIFL